MKTGVAAFQDLQGSVSLEESMQEAWSMPNVFAGDKG